MRKCWYTFILTISLAGAAVTHVFPGWMDHAVLRSGSYLQGKSIAYAKASVPVHGRWTRQKAQKTDKASDPEKISRKMPAKLSSEAEAPSDADASAKGQAPSDADASANSQAVPIPDENFSGVLFIGDSRTVGLWEYGNLGNAQVFANSGMSVYNLFDAKVTLRDGSKKTLEQVLSQDRYLTIYVMLGINELGYDRQRTVAQYRSIVNRIQEMQPEAQLILEANLHVTQKKSSKSPIYNNENINALNGEIKKIADAERCYYINVNELFDDENGNLKAAYTSDGSHVLGKYYSIWVDWIRGAGS